MKYTGKITLSIPMKEFLEFAKPVNDNRKELHKAIKNELYHCFCGITDGENGGSFVDWKEAFYYELFKEGYIMQTQKSIDTYGVFPNSL